MTLSAAAELALRSSVLLAAAWLAAAIVQARRGSPATRHAIWMLGFATIASLPLLSRILPPMAIAVLPAQPVAPAAQLPAAYPLPVQVTPTASSSDIVMLLYAAVAIVLIARLVMGRVLLERIWRHAVKAHDPELAKLCRLLGLRRRVKVRLTTEAVIPMTWGSVRPRILLPRDALTWSPERLRSVLLHELGHVSRHDSLGTLIAQAVCAIYWINPLFWLAVRQMRLAQEQACDDLVLSNGGAATSYARDLLDTACSLHPRLAAASVAMAGRTDLEKRVRSILGEGSRTRLSGHFLSAAGACAALSGAAVATVVPVAAEAPAPVSAEPRPEAEAPPATREATQVRSQSQAVRHSAIQPRRLAPIPMHAAAAPIQLSRAQEYAEARARYEQESAIYQAELAEYRTRFAQYRSDMAQYFRDMDEHRRRVEAIRALPDGDPNKLVPPAPPAPVAPVAPTAPVVPPVPPDLNQS